MLIQSLPFYVAPGNQTVSGATPNGVDEEVLRNDIPPVNAAPKEAGSQNQLFQGREAPKAGPESAQRSAAISENRASEESDTARSASNSTQAPADSAQKNSDSSQKTEQQAAEDKVIIDQLKSRDREVRLHEAAHASVGGQYAGSPSFEYTTGPDGNRYRTGGEVGISTSPVNGDPQATLAKARVIQAAALAPAQPSAQDRRIAAEAAQLELQAQQDLRELNLEEKAEEEEQKIKSQDGPQKEGVNESVDPSVQNSSEVTVQPTVFNAADTSVAASQEPATDESVEDAEGSRAASARADLEQILLGSSNLLQRANQLGLVDPQNPYGKSGYLNIIA